MKCDQSIALDYKVKKKWGPKRRRILVAGKTGDAEDEPAHLARMMAAALRFEELFQRGSYGSFVELARGFGLSWSQVYRIMSLTLLAPDLQETLLRLRKEPDGSDPIGWRGVLDLVDDPNWSVQRRHPVAIRLRALVNR